MVGPAWFFLNKSLLRRETGSYAASYCAEFRPRRRISTPPIQLSADVVPTGHSIPFLVEIPAPGVSCAPDR
jgi:hypothetical protein